jgi:hypothetical protein
LFFPLALWRRVTRVPAPCHAFQEKQRHGKPLPNASK